MKSQEVRFFHEWGNAPWYTYEHLYLLFVARLNVRNESLCWTGSWPTRPISSTMLTDFSPRIVDVTPADTSCEVAPVEARLNNWRRGGANLFDMLFFFGYWKERTSENILRAFLCELPWIKLNKIQKITVIIISESWNKISLVELIYSDKNQTLQKFHSGLRSRSRFGSTTGTKTTRSGASWSLSRFLVRVWSWSESKSWWWGPDLTVFTRSVPHNFWVDGTTDAVGKFCV